MAKTIKFNLLVDENPIRDIKGLQENFCIEDILEVYENGLLEKWLKVRGFDEYLEQVQNLNREQLIVNQLIKIFDVQQDENKIKEAIYSIEFKEQRKRDIEQFKKSKENIENFIEQYHKGYEQLIKEIITQKENMPFLKMASKEISDKYFRLFKLNYKDFYEELKEKVPLMIYAILMNDKLNFCFMENKLIKQNLYENFLEQDKYDIKKLRQLKIHKEYKKDTNYKWELVCSEPVLIIGLSNNDNVWIDIKKNGSERSKFNAKNSIGKIFKSLYFYSYASSDYVKYIKLSDLPKKKNYKEIEKFKGITDGYWKTLETEKTKVMVLSIPNKTFIATPNNPKKEYSSKDINGEFLILDGLLYKSNIDDEPIVYMKV